MSLRFPLLSRLFTAPLNGICCLHTYCYYSFCKILFVSNPLDCLILLSSTNAPTDWAGQTGRTCRFVVSMSYRVWIPMNTLQSINYQDTPKQNVSPRIELPDPATNRFVHVWFPVCKEKKKTLLIQSQWPERRSPFCPVDSVFECVPPPLWSV